VQPVCPILCVLQAILRQEIGWFDRDANSSGALSLLLSNDATHVRGAVADSVGLLLQVQRCVGEMSGPDCALERRSINKNHYTNKLSV
jgi:hypothetical protein